MKNCARCDHSSPENIRHLVMQCPENEKAKEFMFKEILKVDKDFELRCANSADQVLYWLLGKHVRQRRCGCNVKYMDCSRASYK